LAGGTARAERTDVAIRVRLPAGDWWEIDTVIALELDRSAGEIAPLATPDAKGS
jgi:hypothetical protein